MWTKAVEEGRAKIRGLSPAQLPGRSSELERLGRDLLGKPGDRDELRSHAGFILGAALAVALLRRGWSLRAEPGDPVTLEQGGVLLSPFSLFGDLEEKRMTPEQWVALCAQAGISDLDLGAAA
jgi:hypothetical protein